MSGKGAGGFDAEAGGHRIQRVPRTERNGRVHSSTVTVAVFGGGPAADAGPYDRRRESDFHVEWYSGSGAGGQHRNKHQNSARITHLPTGIVRTAQTRSRDNSRAEAMAALHAELDRLASGHAHGTANLARREQVGSGERSDRRRTWAFQHNSVSDYVTGRNMRCSDAMRGGITRLWNE